LIDDFADKQTIAVICTIYI